MRKSLQLIFVIFLMLSLQVRKSSAQNQHTFPDSLRDAGLMRPIHLVRQDIRWYHASTDLFTYWLDSGYYGFYGPQPKVYVDGIPVDINFLDGKI